MTSKHMTSLIALTFLMTSAAIAGKPDEEEAKAKATKPAPAPEEAQWTEPSFMARFVYETDAEYRARIAKQFTPDMLTQSIMMRPDVKAVDEEVKAVREETEKRKAEATTHEEAELKKIEEEAKARMEAVKKAAAARKAQLEEEAKLRTEAAELKKKDAAIRHSQEKEAERIAAEKKAAAALETERAARRAKFTGDWLLGKSGAQKCADQFLEDHKDTAVPALSMGRSAVLGTIDTHLAAKTSVTKWGDPALQVLFDDEAVPGIEDAARTAMRTELITALLEGLKGPKARPVADWPFFLSLYFAKNHGKFYRVANYEDATLELVAEHLKVEAE